MNDKIYIFTFVIIACCLICMYFFVDDTLIMVLITFGIMTAYILNFIAHMYFGFSWFAPKTCERFDDVFMLHNAVHFDKIVECKFKKFIAILDNFPSYFCVLKTQNSTPPSQYKIYANSESAKVVYLSIASRIGLPFKDLIIVSNPKDKPEEVHDYIWAVMFDFKSEDSFFQQIITDLSVDIFDYSTSYDPDIFRLTFPYSYLSGIDERSLLKQSQSDTILKLLTFPNIVYTCVSTIPSYLQVPHDIQILIGQHSIEYDTYFSALGFTQFYLEEFAELKTNIVYTPSKNIEGSLVNIKDLYKRFVLHTTDIEGVYPIINDHITLTNQTRSPENDIYIVTFVNDELKQTVLETSEYVNYYKSSWKVDYTDFVGRRVYLKRDMMENTHVKDMFIKLYFSDLEKPGVYIDNTHAMIYDADYIFNKAGECITDLSIKTRAECNSTPSGLWDRRCVFDSECPFFAEYGKKYRGGCENGYCMMPTGVQRVGYKKYILGNNSYPRKHANGMIAFPVDFT